MATISMSPTTSLRRRTEPATWIRAQEGARSATIAAAMRSASGKGRWVLLTRRFPYSCCDERVLPMGWQIEHLYHETTPSASTYPCQKPSPAESALWYSGGMLSNRNRQPMSRPTPTHATLDDWIAREATPFSVDSPRSFHAAGDKVIASLGDAVALLGF